MTGGRSASKQGWNGAVLWGVVLTGLSPAVFLASLYLVTVQIQAFPVFGIGQALAWSGCTLNSAQVMRHLWAQSMEGTEAIFTLTALVLWSVSWTYILARLAITRRVDSPALLALIFVAMSFLTQLGGDLARLWGRTVTGNIAATVAWLGICAAMWVAYFWWLAGHGPHNQCLGESVRDRR